MIKPHIKVIQRNGVDIFVTSSIEYKSIHTFFTASQKKAVEVWSRQMEKRFLS